jgi:ABC-type molybdate transport system substrate-binding protein
VPRSSRKANPWPQKSRCSRAPAARGAVLALAQQFERETGHKVVADFIVIAVIKRRIEAGEAFDIAIPSPEVIDDFIKQGKIAADTRTAFGRTGLGVVARKGIPTPDISTVDAFKRTLLNAKSVGHSREGQTRREFPDRARQARHHRRDEAEAQNL